jgi:hypothetical protein
MPLLQSDLFFGLILKDIEWAVFSIEIFSELETSPILIVK